MLGLDILIAGLLGWQVFMPAVDNGKYMLWNMPNGQVIRMNTQDGTMVKCDQVALTCDGDSVTLVKEDKKEPITDVVDYR